MDQRHAEIAGAGIAGLTMAAVLAQRGWNVTVHERASELREIGAGIFIWPNGVRALASIDALEPAIAGGTRRDYWHIVDERGRVLQRAFMNEPTYSIARTELHADLARAEQAAGVEIMPGSTVTAAEADGTLVTASGERRRADLAVGADGIGSSVRRSLGIHAKVTDLGYGSQRTFVPPLDDDPQASNPEWWHGRRRLGISPCGPDRTYVYMFCPRDDAAGRSSTIDRVQRYSRIYSRAMTRWPSGLLSMRSACVWSTAHSKTFRRRVMGGV